VLVQVDVASWWSMPAATRRALTADALLYVAAMVVLVAPLAGVTVASDTRASRRPAGVRRALGTAWPLVVAVALYTLTSAALTAVGWGRWNVDAVRFVTTSHATLFTVALALAAFGALCGSTFADPLDAAGFSLTTVVVATGAILVAGVSIADLPRPVIEAALTASPLVAMVSAAHIDVVRMGALYQISPLAHLQVNYPAWYAACGWYLGLAALCFLGVRWKDRAWQATTAS
jgi:hypothetical protein